jgi:hypothetical protein
MDDDFGPDDVPLPGEVTTRAAPPAPAQSVPVTRGNPFAGAHDERTHAGAVTIESQRATAEVQGRMVVAKRFPRDQVEAYARAMQACQRFGLADQGLYRYNRGGKVEGASIRLAEELARIWGNIEFGLVELSRASGTLSSPGYSEMEAFAWDLETNTKSSQKFTVPHVRDRSEDKGGNAVLTSERDIYEITANMGARRMRGRILAILPPELVDDAVEGCKETLRRGLANNQQTFTDALNKLTVKFGGRGVSTKMLVDFLGHPIADSNPDEYIHLRGILSQIEDGARVSEFFGPKPENGGSRLDKLEAATTGKTNGRPPAKASQQPSADTKSAGGTQQAGGSTSSMEPPKAGNATTQSKSPEQRQAPAAGAQTSAQPISDDAVLIMTNRLIKRFRTVKNHDDLSAFANDPNTIRDRAWLAANRPHLAQEVNDAFDAAAQHVSRLV